VDTYTHEVHADRVIVSGTFGYVTHRVPTPLAVIMFHLGMVTVGRLYSNGIRWLLQRLLIVGKKPAALTFRRTVQFQPQLMITDEIWDPRPQRHGKQRLVALCTGPDPTSIYVAMSNAYQAASLLPWTDDTAVLERLQETGYVQITRTLPQP
jgi:hypothetical protein